MTEYWKWKEIKETDGAVDWQKAHTVTAGLDIGSVSTKAAVMCDDKLFSYATVYNDPSDRSTAEKAMAKVLADTGMKLDDINYIVGTGYGKDKIGFIDETLTDVACNARGARYIFGPSVRTIMDIGGQNVRAIKLDISGKPVDFNMNDKCAAAPGRCIETFAEMVAVPIGDIGDISLEVEDDPEPLSSTCVTYANSAASYMMSRGASKPEVLAAHCFGIAWRAHIQLRRLGIEKELGFTGGVSKNKGITSRIEKSLGLNALPAAVDPQLSGAIGAAIYASESVKK